MRYGKTKENIFLKSTQKGNQTLHNNILIKDMYFGSKLWKLIVSSFLCSLNIPNY